MPAGPSFFAAIQPVSSKPASFQPAVSLLPLVQLESVATVSGSPWANSTRSKAISPAGFGSEPSLRTDTASRFFPRTNCPVTSNRAAA